MIEVLSMKNIILIGLLSIGMFLLLGCGGSHVDAEEPAVEVNPTENVPAVVPANENNVPVNEPPAEVPTAVSPEVSKVKIACTHNSNCTSEELCLNDQCSILAELYSTENCPSKCRIIKVNLTTSDNEDYNLPPGQGSYIAASALQWTIMSPPAYCQGSEIIVPIKILKRNYSNILSDMVITLKVGEKSRIITHPVQKQLQFTLMVKGVEESCS